MDSSPIHEDSESGDITAISKLISEGISPNEKDKVNWAPLFTAANANQVNAFEKALISFQLTKAFIFGSRCYLSMS